MFYILQSKFEKHPVLADLIFALFFGLLSLAFGELKFDTPTIGGGQSDFREVPLIISVFYIRKPLFFIIPCLITSLSTQPDGAYFTSFIMHFLAVVPIWAFYKYFCSLSYSVLTKGFAFIIVVIIYFVAFTIPVMIISDKLLGISDQGFISFYLLVLSSIKFEMVATALITSLYLVQFKTRENLVTHQKDLEKIVASRTEDLESANDKLTLLNNELVSSSHEIKMMNENLDKLVKERSKKIETQLGLLIKYTQMNSHEVRAPLARILGLLEIIKLDPELSDAKNIVNELCNSGEELDEIVKNMNRLLEQEIPDGNS